MGHVPAPKTSQWQGEWDFHEWISLISVYTKAGRPPSSVLRGEEVDTMKNRVFIRKKQTNKNCVGN